MWTVRLFRSTSSRSSFLHLPLNFQCSFLSSSQTAEVLRPFIFAVHPDFFGQHPKERAVNEHSLKQLYAHLETIRDESARVTPKDLTFYLRNSRRERSSQQGHSVFRSVTVSLLNRDIYTTVNNLLETCSLPTNNLQEISASRPLPFPRPIEWHHSYYAYTGKTDPYAEVKAKRQPAKDSLRNWLRTNVPIARRNLESSLPIRQETERLNDSLKEQLGLEELRWMSRWDVNTFRACLRSMAKLRQGHSQIMDNLRGKRLVFGSLTGVSREGHVMLSNKNVEQQWLAFLSSLPQQMKILDHLSVAERQLSDFLGGSLRLSRHCCRNLMPAQTYLALLHKMSGGLQRYRRTVEGERDCQRISRGLLADVEINVVGDSGRMYVSSRGALHVTASSQPPELINFLLDNGFRVKDIRRHHQRYLLEEIAAIQACVEELDLTALTKDDSVTAEEMVSCCKRLTENPLELGVSLRDASIRVGHVYMVLWGGELCIPWNWKD
ncbi:T-cell activation inhibitor, mitochondrial-like [Patiria miniata]|uniref:T-cell activation inhibitor, mitochondrial n=1 Tax=Patiria miniata TaxID=46514 RepID=A0A914BKB1_PATMI|nr:T-cell activation inhibitor, mitochondrial-like [Patiria miniata]XP_038076723.1 T-cell activation inhibitor, mitochondrial-like [Patiria miniata]